VDCHNDPIKNSEKRDDTGQQPDHETVIQSLPFYGIKKGDQSKPSQKFEVKIGEGEDEENP
jgi:hypothetical protein